VFEQVKADCRPCTEAGDHAGCTSRRQLPHSTTPHPRVFGRVIDVTLMGSVYGAMKAPPISSVRDLNLIHISCKAGVGKVKSPYQSSIPRHNGIRSTSYASELQNMRRHP